MKIIGKTKIGCIVSIGNHELQKLTGYYHNERRPFEVGDEILVDSLYNQLTSLVVQADEIKKMSHTLKTAAGMLEKINPVFYEETKA